MGKYGGGTFGVVVGSIALKTLINIIPRNGVMDKVFFNEHTTIPTMITFFLIMGGIGSYVGSRIEDQLEYTPACSGV